MFTSPRYDISAKVRAALKAIEENTAEIVRTRAKGDERRQRYDQLIATGAFDDESKAGEAANLHVQIQMVPPVIARLEAREPALLADLDHEARCLMAVLISAQTQTKQAGLESTEKALRPFIADKQALQQSAAEAFQHSDLNADLSFWASAQRPYDQSVARYAEEVLGDCERLLAALTKHAALLPKKFYPLPETEADYLALCPSRPVAAPAAAVPQPTGEERYQQVQQEKRIQAMQSAYENGDVREMDRTADLLGYTDTVEALRGLFPHVPQREIEQLLLANKGAKLSQFLPQLVRRAEAIGAQQENAAASVE